MASRRCICGALEVAQPPLATGSHPSLSSSRHHSTSTFNRTPAIARRAASLGLEPAGKGTLSQQSRAVSTASSPTKRPRYQRDQSRRNNWPKARIDLTAWEAKKSDNAWATGEATVRPRPERVSALDTARKYLATLREQGKPIAPLSEAALDQITELKRQDPEAYTVSKLAQLYGIPYPAMLVEMHRLQTRTPIQRAKEREQEMVAWDALPDEVREKVERRQRARESMGLLALLERRRANGEELLPEGDEVASTSEPAVATAPTRERPRQPGAEAAEWTEGVDRPAPTGPDKPNRPAWLQQRLDDFERDHQRRPSDRPRRVS